MTVIALQRRTPDGPLQALDEAGWFEVHDGDSLDMGGGLVVTVCGPSMLGGGSIKACVAAVLAGFVALGIAALNGIGKS